MSLASFSDKVATASRGVEFWNRFFVAVLLASGFVHLLLFFGSTIAWEAPISFRKPALFGISTGLTLWSCDWCFRQLREARYAIAMRAILGWSLFLEVGLITMQTWRGEASHFNQRGLMNSAIELGMLILIVAAMCIITLLAIRALSGDYLPRVSRSMRVAISWGLVYLVISGAIGFLITFVGHQNRFLDKPPEIWGERGILKFPHGVTIHAIQTLVLVAWLTDRFLRLRSHSIVLSLARLHGVVLVFATLHTVQGRGRFEFDILTMIVSLLGVGFCLVPFLRRGGVS